MKIEHTCPKCSETKDVNQFQKGSGWCRKCRSNLESARRREKGIKTRRLSEIKDGEKLCTSCCLFKEFNDFSPAMRGLGGFSSYCKPCAAVKQRERKRSAIEQRIWRENNRDWWLANHRVRQAKYTLRKKITDDKTVTKEAVVALKAHLLCFYCRKEIAVKDRTLDHVIPLNKGGIHSLTNLVMACKKCNSTKRDMSEKEFREKYDHFINDFKPDTES